MSIRTLFDRAMSVFYITAGIALLATDVLTNVVPDNRTLLGAVLVGYGILRLFLAWRKARRTPPPGTPSRP